MKRMIFLFIYFVALPIIGGQVTEKEEGMFAFMAIVSVPMYFCYFNKKAFNFLLRIVQ